MMKLELTKDEITRSAITELTKQGGRVRKVHNVGAYRKRRYQVESGWADIQGYTKDGKALLCEVKTLRDRLSDDQKEILSDLDKCGGVSLVAIQKGLTVYLMPWCDYLKTLNKKAE
jgi:hypothetical protein